MKTFHPGTSKLVRRDLFVLWILATASLCAGLLLNQFRDKPMSLLYQTKEERLDQAVAQVSSLEGTRGQTNTFLPKSLSLEEFKMFVEKKQGPVLDARPEIFHRLGHVPGAISLPREEFGTIYPKLKDQLEGFRDRPIAVYCSSSSCHDSELVRKALTSLGYSQVSIFIEGWSGWVKAKLPEEKK